MIMDGLGGSTGSANASYWSSSAGSGGSLGMGPARDGMMRRESGGAGDEAAAARRRAPGLMEEGWEWGRWSPASHPASSLGGCAAG